MSTNQERPKAAAAESLRLAPTVTPESAVELLRALRSQIGDVTPLTPQQRTTMRNRARTSNPILQASINVIGASDNVSQAVGQPAGEVRQMYDDANRWTAVEDELRTLLSGVSGANLIRRQRIALIAAQGFTIGSQLARDPAYAVLVPHVQEIKRLKSFKRRKRVRPCEHSRTHATLQSESPAVCLGLTRRWLVEIRLHRCVGPKLGFASLLVMEGYLRSQGPIVAITRRVRCW